MTSTGISFCETLATTTGTEEGDGGAAVCAVQPQTDEIEITANKLRGKFINLRINAEILPVVK
jgi:hypothetical protein